MACQNRAHFCTKTLPVIAWLFFLVFVFFFFFLFVFNIADILILTSEL